jgi:hypothetical protein
LQVTIEARSLDVTNSRDGWWSDRHRRASIEELGLMALPEHDTSGG